MYHGHGPHGFETKGLKQSIIAIGDWVEEAFVHPLGQDAEEAVKALHRKGIFS